MFGCLTSTADMTDHPYRKYQYRPLDLVGDTGYHAIRLIYLDPSLVEGSPLECTIRHAQLRNIKDTKSEHRLSGPTKSTSLDRIADSDAGRNNPSSLGLLNLDESFKAYLEYVPQNLHSVIPSKSTSSGCTVDSELVYYNALSYV